MDIINQITAIIKKEIKSEFRRRYSISSVLLFILTTVTMLVFSLLNEDLNPEISSGIFWVIIFFGAMTGLSRIFISEEERQTSLFLKIATNSTSIYLGKLIFNIILSICLNIFTTILYFLFIDTEGLNSVLSFVINLLLGSIGIAAASTIISAIVSKANTKNTLFPILSFPLLIPLFLLLINSTLNSFYYSTLSESILNFILISAYIIVLISISIILFDIIWEE